MNKTLTRYWENMIRDTIHKDGSDIYITYHQSSACSYCVPLDPVSGEGRFNCTTCHGTGRWEISTTVGVKAVVNRFIGAKNFISYTNEKITLGYEGDARITCWLDDVKRQPFVATSRTYFDSADAVRIGGQYYAVKNPAVVGMDEDTVIVVTLVRK